PSSFLFLSTPHRYPPTPAPAADGTTRWHGTTTATRLLAHARATARAARGSPIAFATSPYVRVSPGGISRSAFHTRCWNAVARRSSGTSTRATSPRSEEHT